MGCVDFLERVYEREGEREGGRERDRGRGARDSVSKRERDRLSMSVDTYDVLWPVWGVLILWREHMRGKGRESERGRWRERGSGQERETD